LSGGVLTAGGTTADFWDPWPTEAVASAPPIATV
jgi:hypothetical protein